MRDECRGSREEQGTQSGKPVREAAVFFPPTPDPRHSLLSFFYRSKWREQREIFSISVSSVASCEKVTVTIEGRVSREKEG